MTRILLAALALLASLAGSGVLAEEAGLRVVGVLGNTSAMDAPPVPYAFYTGIGVDGMGRLYLAGAAEGVVVCDQEGRRLAVVPLPSEASGLTPQSLVCRAEPFLFCIAADLQRSALLRIDTRQKAAADLRATTVAGGVGHWAISRTPDRDGRVVVGRSDVAAHRYEVVALEPSQQNPTSLFAVPMPEGASWPWRHTIQVEPDGSIGITHLGGVNWSGRYDPKGARLGEVMAGQLVDGLRYQLGYSGQIVRTDPDGKPAPGECGSRNEEIRMPAQLIRVGERYFLAGRGGAVEAEWNGTTFVFTRRIGGARLEELVDDGRVLRGIAFAASGNNDVQHPITIAKNQPTGQLLDCAGPLHGKNVETFVVAGEAVVCVHRSGSAVRVFCDAPDHLRFDLALLQVQSAGQAAVLGADMLLADPTAGVVWRRPLLDKQAAVAPWRDGLPGVVGLAAAREAVFVATATQVRRLSADGRKVEWTSAEPYRGIRRLAAAGDSLYVCDAAGHVVDRLDAATGRRLARLGTMGEPGSSPERLHTPYALAADLNAVYVADNGNGRIVVATSTLWRPEIRRLPREKESPIVAAQIPIKPPKSGRISVNVYDAGDLTVRQLACAQPSDAPVLWDGRDYLGRWAEPGRYRYHGIVAPKLGLRYVASVGQSGRPPYRTADGRGSWGGVWANVLDVCTAGPEPDADIIVLWGFEEGEGGIIRMSQDGEVRWKAHIEWWLAGIQTAVACDGKHVYVGCGSAIGVEGDEPFWKKRQRALLWRLDAATGRRADFPGADQQSPRLLGEPVLPKDTDVVTDLAVRDGKVYLTARAQDKLYVIDAGDGKQIAAWPLQGASGVSFDREGRLLAGLGSRIVRLNGQGKVEAEIVADAGGAVWDIETTPDGGLAASIGPPRDQVVTFDAHGREVRAAGRRGGRPLAGSMRDPAVRQSFLKPVGLCVTAGGRLFVAENTTPKRFTRWSTHGELEREFHGPYYYSGMFGIDDQEPEFIYADTHADLVRYRLDYQTGQWDVDHYWIDAYEQSGVPVKWWPRIRRREGKIYWCSGSSGIVELADDRARGVAAVYGGWVERLPDGGYEPKYHNKNTGLKGTWSDLNGDGRKQPDEWFVTDRPAYPLDGNGPQQGWGGYFDENFDLYMHDWSDEKAGGVWRIPVSGWRQGVPVYRWEEARHVGLNRYTGIGRGSHGARTAFFANGAAYGFNGAYNDAGLSGVGHGGDWQFAQITKYDAAGGKPLWHAGTRASGFAAPGEHYCPTGAAGLIGEYLFWTDENSSVHVWDDRHGLYVDTLLEDIARNPPPTPYTVWVELFNSRVFRHPKTGKVYLAAGSDAIHFFEVVGTDQPLVRFDGEFQLTAEQIAAARQQAQKRELARTAERMLVVPRARKPASIDGDLAEFHDAPAASMVFQSTAQGTARLLYDDENLYVAFDVDDDSPWKNSGDEISTLFKTGDTACVWLGPGAGKRPPGIGDVRILFAPPRDAKAPPRVVAFRAKVAAGARPVPFRSPSGELHLDRVEQLGDVRAAVQLRPGGYRLEAAIPWRQLAGLVPDAASGSGPGGRPHRFGLDFSLNFSDPAGQRNTLRLHWGRDGAATVYDLPSEARFEPETWGIGIIEP